MPHLTIFHDGEEFNAVPGEESLEELAEKGAIRVVSRDQHDNIESFDLTDAGMWPMIRTGFIDAIASEAIGCWVEGVESFLIGFLRGFEYEIPDAPPYDEAEKILTETLDKLLP